MLSSGEKVAPAGKISRSNSDSELKFLLPVRRGPDSASQPSPKRIEIRETQTISVQTRRTTDLPPESPVEGESEEEVTRGPSAVAASGSTALDSNARVGREATRATPHSKPPSKGWTHFSDRIPDGFLNAVKKSADGAGSQSSSRRAAGSIMDESSKPPSPYCVSEAAPVLCRGGVRYTATIRDCYRAPLRRSFLAPAVSRLGQERTGGGVGRGSRFIAGNARHPGTRPIVLNFGWHANCVEFSG